MSNDLHIDKTNIPKHIAIIMDGNGRWAKQQGQDRLFGHASGVESVRATIKAAREFGVEFLTLYAFSTENWNRPKEEVDALLNEITQQLEQSIQNISRAAQGQPPKGQQIAAAPLQQYDLDTNFNNLMAIHADNTQTGQYTAFIRNLRGKGKLQKSINDLINSAEKGNPDAIQQLKQVLQENTLIVPPQRAGKRHKLKTMKKNRKQKGGFTYKLKSKRRSITSKSSRKSSRNTTRRSSR